MLILCGCSALLASSLAHKDIDRQQHNVDECYSASAETAIT